MQSNVPGNMVPEEMCVRMEQAADPKEEGIKIAGELIQMVREMPGVAGVHLMPVMWEDVVPVVVERAGLLPRPTAAVPATTEG